MGFRYYVTLKFHYKVPAPKLIWSDRYIAFGIGMILLSEAQ